MNWVGEPPFDEMRAMAARGEMEERARIYGQRPARYAQPKLEYFNSPLVSSSAIAGSSIEQPTDQTTLTKRYTEAAIDFIERNADDPFLVYVPYTMPHTPLFRSSEFVGTSIGGRYGDVVEEIDWSVGQIRRSLEEQGLAENTLIVLPVTMAPG